jgi:hypothetical protein
VPVAFPLRVECGVFVHGFCRCDGSKMRIFPL